MLSRYSGQERKRFPVLEDIAQVALIVELAVALRVLELDGKAVPGRLGSPWRREKVRGRYSRNMRTTCASPFFSAASRTNRRSFWRKRGDGGA
jgi:hypothetical protein